MKIKNLPIKLVALAVMAAFPVALLAQTSQSHVPGTYNVYMYDNYYAPQHLTVAQGSTVRWQNFGNDWHTVTFNNMGVNSGAISPGGSFSWTFNTVGTFNYNCQFHPGMTGSITVTSSGGGGGGGSSGSLTGTVTHSDGGGGGGSGQIFINSITRIKTSGMADGNFQNGWQWVFDVSVPWNETNVSMRFNNWMMQGGSSIIPVANNVRFYSAQSSNANNQNNAVYITSPGVYSSSMTLTGNLGGAPSGMRRVNITVETRIPSGTPMGTYSTDFGIRSN